MTLRKRTLSVSFSVLQAFCNNYIELFSSYILDLFFLISPFMLNNVFDKMHFYLLLAIV
jgi:hypothetical protein